MQFALLLAAAAIAACGGADSAHDAGPLDAAPAADASPIDEISVGIRQACARRRTGAVECWSPTDLAATTVADLPAAAEIDVGGGDVSMRAACARASDGRVWCWGTNGHGQLGDGIVDHGGCRFDDCSETPVAVATLEDAVEVASGHSHACARRSTGSLVCWGSNQGPRLGDGVSSHMSCPFYPGGEHGSEDCSPVPVAVLAIDDAREVSAGGVQTCARRASGSIDCWGNPGAFGDAWSETPAAVDGVSDVAELGCGEATTCARLDAGQVVCWGAGWAGQLGNGDKPWGSQSPQTVVGLDDAVEIAVGTRHACARRVSGEVVCWGSNWDSELGDDSSSHEYCDDGELPFDCSTTPVTVSGLTDAVEIDAGGSFTCARTTTDSVVCWGGGIPHPTPVTFAP